MRKFRLVKNAWGYNEKLVAGGVYDETICPWWSEYPQDRNVLDAVKRFPEDWEEVFEETKPVRKFRLVKNACGYGKLVAGGVYDETICPWWSEYLQDRTVLDAVKRFPENWEEVFEDEEPTLEDRVNELEMSYVGAEHFEEVVEMLDEKIKVLESLIKKPYEQSEKSVLYKFVGNPVDYYWNKNPLRGNVYTKDQIASMYGSGFHTRPFNVIVRDFEIVSDEISKPEQKLLPQKYQLIEVRTSNSCEWVKRIFVSYDGRYVETVANTGDDIDGTDLTITTDWEQWRFIEG